MNILSYSLIALSWYTVLGNSTNYVLLAFLILTLMSYMWLLRRISFLQQKSDFCLKAIHKTNNSLMNTRSMLEDLASGNIPYSISTLIKRIAEQTGDIIHSNKGALSLYERKSVGNFNTDEYELYTYLTSLINHSREYAEHCGVKLNVCKDAGYGGCHINETALTAALQGLVERSIENTPPEGSVDLVVSCQDGRWSLEISNCPSVKGYQRYLGLFFTSMKVSCSGNLRFIWQVVRSHGGKITGYELGSSSYYKITIPLSEDNPLMEEISNTSKLPHILLVMKDKELSGYLQTALSRLYRVSVYEHYENISDSITHWNTDIILVDEAAGDIRLCSEIKSNKRTSDVTVLLLTASEDVEDREEIKECGADGFLPRLVHTERLRTELHAVMEERKQKVERVIKLVNTDTSADFSQDLMLSEADAGIMRKINGILEAHLTEICKREELARDLGVCRTNLYTLVRRITMVSPTYYILSFKMEKAKKLLLARQYTVEETATLVGYGNGRYFGKQFKKYCGVSPKEYVKKHGKQFWPR